MWVKVGKFSTWAGDCLVSITSSDQECYYSSLSGMLVHRKVNPSPPPSISLGFFDDSPKSIYTPRWRGALWVFPKKNKMRLRSFMKSSLKMSEFNFPGAPCRIWPCRLKCCLLMEEFLKKFRETPRASLAIYISYPTSASGIIFKYNLVPKPYRVTATYNRLAVWGTGTSVVFLHSGT